MNVTNKIEDFGTITAPMTLSISRNLAAPPERVWEWLTDGNLRRRWLAARADRERRQ